MIIYKYNTFSIILIFALLCFSCNRKNELYNVDDSVEIYSVILEKISTHYQRENPNEFVSIIISQISDGRGGGDTNFFGMNSIDSEFKWLKHSMKSLKQETFNDFVKKNGKKNDKINQFSLSLKNTEVLFINDSTLQEIFIYLNGWNEFYNRYPKSRGFISFSKVGFDPNKKQALMIFAKKSGWTSGDGHYVLFEKIDNKWELTEITSIWIS